jgi:hypothetical protein
LKNLKKLPLFGLLVLANKAVNFYKLKIPLSDLQKQIVKNFPIQKEKYFLLITLADPVVKLDAEKNRVGIIFTTSVNTAGHVTASWRSLIDGQLHYHREAGAFYLSELKIYNNEKGESSDTPAASVLYFMETMLNMFFLDVPIYRLDDKNLKHILARLLLKTISVQKEKLVITFNLY